MDKIIEIFGEFRDFIIKEFLWLFATALVSALLTLLSLWLMHEFMITLVERLEWQGLDEKDTRFFLWILWLIFIYLVRFVRAAIIYVVLPKIEEITEEEE